MSRPQKYTDSDITAAIQALVAAGETINPMRVRLRLGGGNVARIKALIAESGETVRQGEGPLPDVLSDEFQRISGEILVAAQRSWAAALSKATRPLREENSQLRQQVESLEARLANAISHLAQLDKKRDEQNKVRNNHERQKTRLAQTHEQLQAALRNSESDLRAARQMIETFERHQRQDRQDIRDLQKRIESLVAEVATLRR